MNNNLFNELLQSLTEAQLVFSHLDEVLQVYNERLSLGESEEVALIVAVEYCKSLMYGIENGRIFKDEQL